MSRPFGPPRIRTPAPCAAAKPARCAVCGPGSPSSPISSLGWLETVAEEAAREVAAPRGRPLPADCQGSPLEAPACVKRMRWPGKALPGTTIPLWCDQHCDTLEEVSTVAYFSRLPRCRICAVRMPWFTSICDRHYALLLPRERDAWDAAWALIGNNPDREARRRLEAAEDQILGDLWARLEVQDG